MLDTTLRQLEMLRRVPRLPAKIDAPGLARQFAEEGVSVTVRTIQRDLEKLSTMFPLVVDDTSKPYGWSWARDAVVDLPGMDLPTALTFALASDYLAPLFPRAELQRLAPHFKRAKHLLNELPAAGVGDWPSKVRALPRGLKLAPPKVDEGIMDRLYDAILQGRRLLGTYRPRDAKEPREYEISPLAIVLRDGITYVLATLNNYTDVVQLVAHRFIKAEITTTPSTPPADFDLDAYIDAGGFGYPQHGDRVSLECLFDRTVAQHLLETPLSDDQVATELGDGRVSIKATVRDTLELRWWLMGFGAQVEVIAPTDIRHAFRDTFVALADRYTT